MLQLYTQSAVRNQACCRGLGGGGVGLSICTELPDAWGGRDAHTHIGKQTAPSYRGLNGQLAGEYSCAF